MNFSSIVKFFTFPILGIFLLTGCGEGVGAFSDSLSSSVQLGSGTGTSFQSGVLTLGATTVGTSGTVSVTVDIVDLDNAPVTSSVTVTFTSTCSASSLASFTPASDTTTTGSATTTYTNAGCTTTDLITATVTNPDGTDVTATGSLAYSATGPVLRIGSDPGTGFVDGTILLGASSVITGGRTTISVDIVDSTGAPYLTQISVTFESTCGDTSLATITRPTVSTTTGTASTDYIDNGCLYFDSITVTLKTGGLEPTASGSIDIIPIRIGSGSGATFTDTVLTLSVDPINAGESTDISLTVVDGNEALINTTYTVTFTSTCSAGSFTSSTVTAVNGAASTTYTDNGCPGSDFITATLDNRTSAPDPQATSLISINPLRIGSGSGVGFTPNILTIGIPAISATGSTSVSANIVDSSGNLITKPYSVSFQSNCVDLGLASFNVDSTLTSGGTATVTYTASGCSGTDTIQATATPFTGVNLVATGDVTIASPSAGSIQFTSNSDPIIALQGTGITTGLPETSVVTFTVVDGSGTPISGQDVTFALNTSVGGITLQSGSDTSDSLGEVQATVQSGNVATSVRVTAILTSNPALTTQSAAIVISTGLPDQDSMSLSADILNPQAWNHDGIEVGITARVADRFNNRIQDGTSISFTTELGSIGGSCQTVDGACSVTWISQSPRGVSGQGTNAGRTTILATVIGEESFIDVNGNGVFDTLTDTYTDLPEAFVDYNEDGSRQTNEPYTDFNNSGTYNNPSTHFEGVQCTGTECNPLGQKTLSVRDSLVLVMAESNIFVEEVKADGAVYDYANNPGLDITSISRVEYRIVGAVNEQILPAGTEIKFSITNGKIIGGGSHIVANTSINVDNALTTAELYTVYVAPNDNDTIPSTGALTGTVTLPNGLEVSLKPIPMSD